MEEETAVRGSRKRQGGREQVWRIGQRGRQAEGWQRLAEEQSSIRDRGGSQRDIRWRAGRDRQGDSKQDGGVFFIGKQTAPREIDLVLSSFRIIRARLRKIIWFLRINYAAWDSVCPVRVRLTMALEGTRWICFETIRLVVARSGSSHFSLGVILVPDQMIPCRN